MTFPAVARATTPSALLAGLVASDPGGPRLTWYDDADGLTRGERIELSARVIANWTAKAANLLVDELDVEAGDVVQVDLPVHWRAVYWMLAALAAGAEVGFRESADEAAVVVTDRPHGRTSGARVVSVSLPALARRWTGEALPSGALDEAAAVGSQPDVFTPLQEPAGTDVVARARALAGRAGWQDGERVVLALPSGHSLDDVLTAVLAAWSVDGSVVLVRDPDEAAQPARLEAERVTSAYDPGDTPASRS